MPSRPLVLALFLGSIVLGAFGCGSGGPRPRPDLILIVIDTLRADHLGAWGYPRPTSPNLDALAREGTTFLDATSTSSWTRPAMASLFTGRLPSEHAIVASTDVVAAGLPTLAERLSAVGYRTVGVTGNFVHVNDASGLSAGFEPFAAVSVRSSGDDDDVFFEVLGSNIRAPQGQELNGKVFAALDGSRRSDGQPLFLYVHYMDPHSGYLAPERWRERFRTGDVGPPATSDHVVEVAAGRRPAGTAERARLVDLYDAEIAFVDEAVAELLDGLAARGVGRDAVVVVVSDHGEEFLDHGGWFHGFTLHREQLHVPLIIRDRGGSARGVRRMEPVDLTDVFATLLAQGGAAPDAGSPGRDLLAPGPIPPRPRVAQLEPDPLREARVHPIRHRRAVGIGPWKAIVDVAGQGVAYRLDRDPRESVPVAIEAPEVPDTLRQSARSLAEEARSRAPAAAAELSPEEREGLRALGYAE